MHGQSYASARRPKTWQALSAPGCRNVERRALAPPAPTARKGTTRMLLAHWHAERIGYDYGRWARAHAEILPQSACCLPGQLAGRSMRERGPKGATLVTIEGTRVINLESKALDVLRFCVCEVDVAEAASFDAILEATARALRRVLKTTIAKTGPSRPPGARRIAGVGVLLMHPPSRCLDRIRASRPASARGESGSSRFARAVALRRSASGRWGHRTRAPTSSAPAGGEFPMTS